jgi:hypothetical protein
MLTPINLPIPNVMAAASSPKITCRKPEYQTDFPVNNVIAAPIRNNPNALRLAQAIIACIPSIKKNGSDG